MLERRRGNDEYCLHKHNMMFLYNPGHKSVVRKWTMNGDKYGVPKVFKFGARHDMICTGLNIQYYRQSFLWQTCCGWHRNVLLYSCICRLENGSEWDLTYTTVTNLICTKAIKPPSTQTYTQDCFHNKQTEPCSTLNMKYWQTRNWSAFINIFTEPKKFSLNLKNCQWLKSLILPFNISVNHMKIKFSDCNCA